MINPNIDTVVESTRSVKADENATVLDLYECHENYYSSESSDSGIDSYESDSDLEEETNFSRLMNFVIEIEMD